MERGTESSVIAPTSGGRQLRLCISAVRALRSLFLFLSSEMILPFGRTAGIRSDRTGPGGVYQAPEAVAVQEALSHYQIDLAEFYVIPPWIAQ
jgi:hypothetical protein